MDNIKVEKFKIIFSMISIKVQKYYDISSSVRQIDYFDLYDKDTRGAAFWDNDHVVAALNSGINMDAKRMVATVFHETRHAWQLENYSDIMQLWTPEIIEKANYNDVLCVPEVDSTLFGESFGRIDWRKYFLHYGKILPTVLQLEKNRPHIPLLRSTVQSQVPKLCYEDEIVPESFLEEYHYLQQLLGEI